MTVEHKVHLQVAVTGAQSDSDTNSYKNFSVGVMVGCKKL